MKFYFKVLIVFFWSVGVLFSNTIFANTDNTTYKIKVVENSKSSTQAILGGKVVSSAVVNLSAQLNGDIITVSGKEGSYFKNGDKIISIEDDSIRAKRDSIIAEIASAEEGLKNAKVRYSQAIVSPNSNQMFGGMFNTFSDPVNQMFGNSNPDFDRYANRTEKLTGLNQAKNRLKQAQSKLKQVESQLKNAIISAPFNGIVVEKNVSVGDVVHVGQNLIKFSNLKQLQIEVNIPSRLIRSLKIGSMYRVKVDTLKDIVLATLVQIYPIADNAKHSIKIKLDLPKDLPVLPGIYAELELTTYNNTKIPVIPYSSVLWRSSLPSVFIVNKYNKIELRFVRVGDRIGENIEILTGLKAGQRVIVNPNVYTVSGASI